MKDFDQLKELLVGRESRSLDELQARFDDTAARTRDVAEILPDAIRVGSRDGDRLASALQRPVGHCIRRSIERDTKTYADALFPVMGPAIRRAISETLKSFVQSINQAVEHSLSLRGLRWRWEAWRSGVPFAAVVLKHTIVYRVEAAYLIHNDSGLLVAHVVATTHTTLKDEDAVSAMLTAIQDFMQDSFADVGQSNLETVEIGERSLWVIKDADATLACVISGIPPVDLRSRLESVLAETHAVYGSELADFNGDKSALPGVETTLDRCLTLEFREEEEQAQRRPAIWPWILALGLALSGLFLLWWQHQEREHSLSLLRQRLHSEPGIFVVDWWRDGDQLTATLLRDPLAPEPEMLVTDPGLRQNATFSVIPFQSLEPSLVLERARQALRPPAGVELQLTGSTLTATGSAPPDWLERVRASLVPPAGVTELELTGVSADLGGLLEAVREALQPPSAVTLALDGKSLQIAGSAPWEWIQRVPERLHGIDLIEHCDLGALQVAEWEEAQTLAAELEASNVFFSEKTVPAPKAKKVMAGVSQIIDRLGALDTALRMGLRIRVIGESDGLGSKPWNLWLRRERADFVRDALIAGGAVPELLAVEVVESFGPSSTPKAELRRVRFEATLTPPPMPPCLP